MGARIPLGEEETADQRLSPGPAGRRLGPEQPGQSCQGAVRCGPPGRLLCREGLMQHFKERLSVPSSG